MIYKESLSDLCSGVDLDPGYKAGELGDKTAQKKQFLLPDPVGYPVQLDRMQARVAEQHLKETAGCRISIKDRVDVIADVAKHRDPPYSASVQLQAIIQD